MKGLHARLLLLNRNRWQGIEIHGVHWRHCTHHSHALGLTCRRWAIWDSFCAKHNDSCWDGCPDDPFGITVD